MLLSLSLLQHEKACFVVLGFEYKLGLGVIGRDESPQTTYSILCENSSYLSLKSKIPPQQNPNTKDIIASSIDQK